MPTLFRSGASWLRRNLAWSNSRQSWRERAAFLFLLAAAAALLGFRRALSAPQQVVLWGLLLLALAALLRRGWLKLFGPVFFYDMVRNGRHFGSYLVPRVYLVFLGSLLLCVGFLRLAFARDGRLPSNEMAEFTSMFFYLFVAVQFVTVSLLTPAYAGGAIAQEKDRKTLEFLLATDLRDREIVLSKLASRLCSLLVIVLAGLPVVMSLQFLGGVDPDLVVAATAATALTVFSLAGLSILNSVLTKRPRDAITLTYLVGVAYLALSGMAQLIGFSTAAGFPSTAGWQSPVTLGDLAEWFGAGNVVLAFVQLVRTVGGGGTVGSVLPTLLRNYAVFHLAVGLACSAWAVLRLRAVALKETYGRAQKLGLFARWLGRPRVGTQPMLWKELVAEPPLRLHWFVRLVLVLFVVGSFVPVGFIFHHFVELLNQPAPTYRGASAWYFDPYAWLAMEMNIWVRFIGTLVACLMLLGVAVRAAGGVSGERDRQTFDVLLTTPLGSHAMLLAKWLGAIVSVRWAWLWIGAIAFLGVVTGGLHPLAVPVLAGAWLVYAAFFAGVGTWFSVVSRTTLRATVWTILACVGLSVGHWLVLGFGCYLPLALMGVHGRNMEYVYKTEFSQTPPAVLAWLALYGRDFDYAHRSKETYEMTAFALFGVASWAVFAAGVVAGTAARFRRVTNRAPTMRPDRPDEVSPAVRRPRVAPSGWERDGVGALPPHALRSRDG